MNKFFKILLGCFYVSNNFYTMEQSSPWYGMSMMKTFKVAATGLLLNGINGKNNLNMMTSFNEGKNLMENVSLPENSLENYFNINPLNSYIDDTQISHPNLGITQCPATKFPNKKNFQTVDNIVYTANECQDLLLNNRITVKVNTYSIQGKYTIWDTYAYKKKIDIAEVSKVNFVGASSKNPQNDDIISYLIEYDLNLQPDTHVEAFLAVGESQGNKDAILINRGEANNAKILKVSFLQRNDHSTEYDQAYIQSLKYPNKPSDLQVFIDFAFDTFGFLSKNIVSTSIFLTQNFQLEMIAEVFLFGFYIAAMSIDYNNSNIAFVFDPIVKPIINFFS